MCPQPSLQRFEKPQRTALRSTSAFTLIEVILAISIATALLIAALIFYRQAATLRGLILSESDRLATMRLILDRLANDLRSAQVQSGRDDGFTGTSDTLTFTRSTLTTSLPGTTGDGSGLLRITYSAARSQDGTNRMMTGLNRHEESPGAPHAAVTSATGFVVGDANPFTGVTEVTNRPGELLTDLVRFMRLRYWDGAAWVEGWTNAAPPPGVEIVLSTEPPAEEGTPDPSAPEQFRRVVFLPTGMARRKPELDGLNALLSP